MSSFLKKNIEKIDKCSNVEELNSTFEDIIKDEHYLTSKDELWFRLCEKAKTLGFNYDKKQKCFI